MIVEKILTTNHRRLKVKNIECNCCSIASIVARVVKVDLPEKA